MNYNIDLNTSFLKRRQSPKRYWKFVAKSNNLLGTAITENSRLNPKKAYFDLYSAKPKNKILIPGVTVSTDSGDILVYSQTPELYDYGVIYEENVSIKRIYELCEKKGYLLSIAHPFGLINNSASYMMGLSKLEKFIKEKNVGIEAYNGMIGYLSYYMYDSFFLKTTRDFLDFVHSHKPFNVFGMSKLAGSIHRKIDQKSYDMVYKFAATIKLSQTACFITAGSGTDYVDRIGSGVVTLDLPKSFFEDSTVNQLQTLLGKISKKDIVSFGPPGKYTDELFERSTARITKKKAYDDLVYLTKTAFTVKKKGKKK